MCPSRIPARARCWSRSRPAVSATPTSTPPAATGRSSPRSRSSPAMRESASWRPRQRRGHRGRRRPGGAALAGRRLRPLPLLRRRLGDLLHQPAVHGLHHGRLLRRVRRRQRLARGHGAGRGLLLRRCTADLRRCDDVQGAEGRPPATGRDRHGRRHRRSRPPGTSVRQDLRHHAPWPSTSTTPSCSWPRTSAPTTSSTLAATRRPSSPRSAGSTSPSSPCPRPGAMQAAHAALNPNGRLVIVGLPADNRLELPVFETVLKGISVIGSLVGTRNDLHDTFALHARGPHPRGRRDAQARRRQRLLRGGARRRRTGTAGLRPLVRGAIHRGSRGSVVET